MAKSAALAVENDNIALELIALDEAGGDVEKATTLMADRLLADPELVKAHLRDWASSWARAKVHRAIGGWRQSIIRQVGAGQSFSNGLATAITNEFTRLMDMPIFGGKRLGDATPAEVRESAERYLTSSKDMLRKSLWQSAVADEAEKNGDANTPISSTLSEPTLVRLWGDANV